MKHLLALTYAALMACTGVHAQNISDNPVANFPFADDFSYIPAELTADKKTKLTSVADGKIEILDNFNSFKSIALEQIETYHYIEHNREEVVELAERQQWRNYYIEPDSVETYINRFNYSCRSGDSLIYLTDNKYDFYKFDKFGTKYLEYGWEFDFRTNMASGIYQSFSSSYTGDWIEEEKNINTENNFARCRYIDYDSSNPSKNSAYVVATQLLFNNDNKYEYIKYKGIMKSDVDSVDRDGDGVIDSEIENAHYYYNGIEIVSEDGIVLQSVDFGYISNSIYLTIIKLNGNYYLSAIIQTEGEQGFIHFDLVYSIDNNKGGTSVQQIGSPRRISAYPTLVDRNTTIRVQTQVAQNDRSMTVTDASGKIVWKQILPAGQTETQINTYHLSHGLNIIRIEGENKGDNSCKIIVK